MAFLLSFGRLIRSVLHTHTSRSVRPRLLAHTAAAAPAVCDNSTRRRTLLTHSPHLAVRAVCVADWRGESALAQPDQIGTSRPAPPTSHQLARMSVNMLNASLDALERQAEHKILAELYRARELERSRIRGVYFSGPVTRSVIGIHNAQTLRSASDKAAHRSSGEFILARRNDGMLAKPAASYEAKRPVTANLQPALARVWSARRIDAARVEGLPGSRAYHDVLLPNPGLSGRRTPPTQLVMYDNHAATVDQAVARDKARLQNLERQRQSASSLVRSASTAEHVAPRVPSYRPIAPWAKWHGGWDL